MKKTKITKEDRELERLLKYRETDSFKKLWNYVLGLVDTEKFKKDVVAIRTAYDLPISGIKSGSPDRTMKLFRSLSVQRRFYKNLRELIFSVGLGIEWSDTIGTYILYGFLIEPYWLEEKYNQCLFTMIPFEVDFKTLKTVRDVREAYDLINKSHPFAIRFTPYISQTELIDYIRSIFKQDIEPVLKKARDPGIKIGKRRSRVHGDRDKFISERLNTKRRDVQDMVNKKFHQQVSLKYISVIRKRVKDNNK